MSLEMMLASTGLEEPICSRAECKESARYKILWRNPKIHDTTRTKTWLACDEHKEYLSEYLQARNFPTEIVTF